MKKTKQAFSMVELIIAVSIIIIISVVAVTSMDSVKDKSNNTKILSDVETLRNGFQAYSQEKSEYPTPKGNLQFYGDDTGYRHSYDEAFGVSGFVTDDTLPKKYLNNLPLDPKTGQYYAYAKTKDTNHFEIAGVVFENNIPTSFVAGNWKGEFGPYNLVKEYAGPNFVYDKGTDYFPYNPYEKMLVAKIASYSGVLLINDKTMTNTEIFSYNLGQGDKVSIGTGGTANLYYSDGSNSVLGDMNSKSEVVLAHMKFVEDNNLFTSVKLALNVGSLWTKASKLSDKSDFEVYTTDAVAAVRGTIFGMKKDTGSSDIVVQEGKIEVKDTPSISTESLINKIKNKENIGASFNSSQTAGVMQIEDSKSYIEVKSGSGSKGIKIFSNGGILPNSSTGAIIFLPVEAKENIIDNIPEINEGQEIEIISYSALSGITIKNSPTLQKAQKLILKKDSNGIITVANTGTNKWDSSLDINVSFNGGSYKINDYGSIGIGKYELLFCKEKNGKDSCTKTISLDINDTTNYVDNKEYIDTCTEDVDRFYNSVFNRKPYKIECKEILDSFIDEQKKVGYNEKNKTDLKIELIKKTLKGEDCITYKKKFGKNSLNGYSNCQLIALSTYRWKKGNWSSCNKTCGGGVQSRIIQCANNDIIIVEDNYCSGLKPIQSQGCNLQECGGGDDGGTPTPIIGDPGTYEGCNQENIVLTNGQIWAACNLGTNTAGTGSNSYGSYYSVVDEVVNSSCGDGYKVPTKEDWQNLLNNFSGNYNNMISTLKFPKAGVITNSLINTGLFGGYLTSSKNVGVANGFYRASITGQNSPSSLPNFFIAFYSGTYKYSIRCIRN